MATPAGFEHKVSFIWKIADTLRGHLKPHEYGTVMLPTLVLFRLDAVLEPTKAAVLARAQTLDRHSAASDRLLRTAAGQSFYNTSPLTMTLAAPTDPNLLYGLQRTLGDAHVIHPTEQAAAADALRPGRR